MIFIGIKYWEGILGREIIWVKFRLIEYGERLENRRNLL